MVTQVMGGQMNYEVSLLEMLVKELLPSMCSDSGLGWALQSTHLGLYPLVASLEQGKLGFFFKLNILLS